MIKKLLFTAALLVPGLAYGGNPSADLPVQIVPATAPTPPPAAQAAGFTTGILLSDFTSPAYANASTWLACAGATNPIWWQYKTIGTDHVPPPPTCPSMVTDGGVQALRLIWTPTDNSTGNFFNSITSDNSDNLSQGTQFPGGTFYVEGLMRWSSTPANAFLNGPWAATPYGCSIEFDSFEYTGGWTDGAFHNCGGGALGMWGGGDRTPHPPSDGYTGPNPPGFDLTQYHTYGMRVTTDGSTAMWQCNYIDNILQGCINVTSLLGGASGATLTAPGLLAIIGAQVGYVTWAGQVPSTINQYVKHVYIWSCANWQSSNQVACKTSNPNP